MKVSGILKISDIGLMCVQELQQNVDEFQRESKIALEGLHMPGTAKLQQLIDQGQNLGVELTECRPLKWVTTTVL